MNIIDLYYYLFYKFYILFEAFEQTRWLTKEKAALCVGTLELGIYFSAVNYINLLLQRNDEYGFFSFIIILIISLLKWFAFYRNDQWKQYVEKFDSWPSNKNLKGSWVVSIIVVIIVINFIISCVLFSPFRGVSI